MFLRLPCFMLLLYCNLGANKKQRYIDSGVCLLACICGHFLVLVLVYFVLF